MSACKSLLCVVCLFVVPIPINFLAGAPEVKTAEQLWIWTTELLLTALCGHNTTATCSLYFPHFVNQGLCFKCEDAEKGEEDNDDDEQGGDDHCVEDVDISAEATASVCTLLTIYHNYLEQLPMAPLQAALMALPAPYCDGGIPALLLPRARSPPCSLQYTIHSCSYQHLFYLLALWLSEYLLYYYV